MGVDIVSVGIRHKIRVKKPMELIEDVSRLFNANVQVIYHNYKRKDVRIVLLDFKKDSATENLVLEIPECSYLQQHTSSKCPIDADLQSELLAKEL